MGGVGVRSALGVAGADAGPRSLARSRAVHYYDRAAGATPAGDLILDGHKKPRTRRAGDGHKKARTRRAGGLATAG